MVVNAETVFGNRWCCIDRDMHVRTSYQFFCLKSIKNVYVFLSHIWYAWLIVVKRSTYQVLGNFSL